MEEKVSGTKRRFIRMGGLIGTAAIAAPVVMSHFARGQEGGVAEKLKEIVKGKKEEVTPPEDLMREHGALDRVLLIYEAAIRKLASNEAFDPALLTQSAEIVRDFIHNYHEKLEEDHVFPRFRQAGQQVDLVEILLRQHDAGRNVTQSILRLAPSSRQDGDDRRRLVAAMQSFIVMYRPHAAREDTDLFPKLRNLVSSSEYDSMAEAFEEKERQLFGEDGFGRIVARIARLEQEAGVHDLNQFTPH